MNPLGGVVRERVGYPDALGREVEEYLTSLSLAREPAVKGLEDAMRYSLLAGGKRIRPVLSLATAKTIGLDCANVLPLAAAIELIHTYSLIHDDLPAMDDDDLRRGQPSCHKKYGEAVAILAGDALFAEAFNLVLSAPEVQPTAALAAIAELARATGVDGMVGGQYIDITQQVDEASALRRLHELKTGKLIVAAIDCVLLWADEQSLRPAFGLFSEKLGLLFQVVDDILDVTGDDDSLGKTSGSDARQGRFTYVSCYGLEEGAREFAHKTYLEAKTALKDAVGSDGNDLDQMTDFIYTRQS